MAAPDYIAIITIPNLDYKIIMSPAMHLRKPKIKFFLIFLKNAAISAFFNVQGFWANTRFAPTKEFGLVLVCFPVFSVVGTFSSFLHPLEWIPAPRSPDQVEGRLCGNGMWRHGNYM